MDGLERARARRPATRGRSQPSQSRAAAPRSIATMRAGALGMRRRCRARSDEGWRSRSGLRHAGTVPRRWRPTATATAVDVAVVGAGAAGLYAALTAAGRGRARRRSSPRRRWPQTASYWAQGGLAAALAADDSPDLHRRDTRARRPRARPRRSAATVLCREAPRACATWRRSACASTPIATATWRSGSRAATRGGASCTPGGSATGRRVVARPLGARRRATARIDRPRARPRLGAVDRRAAAASASCARTGARARRARWSWPPAAARRCGGARRTHPGSLGIGLMLARGAGAALADLELVQFHPTAVTGVPGPRGLPRHGGDPRRGRDCCSTPTASASSTSWRRATRWRGRSRAHGPRAARRPCRWTCAASTRRPSPTSSRRCARRGSIPRRSSSRSPPPPTTGWAASSPTSTARRRSPACYAVGEARLHRPARRQPAGLELACRSASSSARAPGSRRSTSRAAARRATPPPPPAPVAVPVAGDADRAVARRRGSCASREGLERLAGDEHPLARADRRVARSCARRPAAPTCAPTIPPRPRPRPPSHVTCGMRRSPRRAVGWRPVSRQRNAQLPRLIRCPLGTLHGADPHRAKSAQPALHVRFHTEPRSAPGEDAVSSCIRSAERSTATSRPTSRWARRPRARRPRMRVHDRAPGDRPPLLRPAGPHAVPGRAPVHRAHRAGDARGPSSRPT